MILTSEEELGILGTGNKYKVREMCDHTVYGGTGVARSGCIQGH